MTVNFNWFSFLCWVLPQPVLAIKKFEVVLSSLIRKCAEKINHVNQLASLPPSSAPHYKLPVKRLLP